ncbi:MAG TPA: PilT/PilU family type 4a pilus ATPase [Burkholderiales bacterium]|nr:PilT/PilU family type 4a pilus ATPase [Burkholderiales bacterium]
MFMDPLLKLMADKKASDLFFSVGAPITMKIDGVCTPLNADALKPELCAQIANELMSEEQRENFATNLEMNFSFRMRDVGNFRVNVFRQRGQPSVVIRRITSTIPTVEELHLPPVLNDLIMERRGLILVVGATGSGKSTTLAAMIEHRNLNRTGHILTVEDPIEFTFRHRKSLVNQREVGIDTLSYSNALVNAMREAPDVMMIGEVRERETFRHALIYAQTGHLCLTTLHANNSYHAFNRIVNFFPYDARAALLADMAASLRAIISQRLVRGKDGKLLPAVEVMLNTKFVTELITKGEFDSIKEAMEQSLSPGSQTFEQALFRLLQDERITREEAMASADSPSNLAALIDYAERPSSGIASVAGARRDDTDFDNISIDAALLDKK